MCLHPACQRAHISRRISDIAASAGCSDGRPGRPARLSWAVQDRLTAFAGVQEVQEVLDCLAAGVGSVVTRVMLDNMACKDADKPGVPPHWPPRR